MNETVFPLHRGPGFPSGAFISRHLWIVLFRQSILVFVIPQGRKNATLMFLISHNSDR